MWVDVTVAVGRVANCSASRGARSDNGLFGLSLNVTWLLSALAPTSVAMKQGREGRIESVSVALLPVLAVCECNAGTDTGHWATGTWSGDRMASININNKAHGATTLEPGSLARGWSVVCVCPLFPPMCSLHLARGIPTALLQKRDAKTFGKEMMPRLEPLPRLFSIHRSAHFSHTKPRSLTSSALRDHDERLLGLPNSARRASLKNSLFAASTTTGRPNLRFNGFSPDAPRGLPPPPSGTSTGEKRGPNPPLTGVRVARLELAKMPTEGHEWVSSLGHVHPEIAPQTGASIG